MMFGEPIWVVVNVVLNPHQGIQAGWGGFGAVIQPQTNPNEQHDMTMG